MTPDHQCEASDSEMVVAEQNSEFRTRWIGRLDRSTDDWALKTKLLETLEDAYLAPEAPPDSDYLSLSRYLSFFSFT